MIRKIFIPFTIIFTLLSGLTLWQSARSVNKLIEREYWGRTERVIHLLSSRPYLLTSSIISQIEELTDSKIALYDSRGLALHSISKEAIAGKKIYQAFPALRPEIMEKAMSAPDSRKPAYITVQGHNRVFFQPVNLPSRGKIIVAVMVSDTPLIELRKNIIWTLGLYGLSGILLSLGLVILLSRILGSNFKSLLANMENIAKGNFDSRFQGSTLPELQRIADTFNNMAERLVAYKHKLQENERLAASGKLSLSLAHEVRNPLTAIKMMGQVLRRRFAKDRESVRLIDAMLKEIERINTLVKDIMTWNRPTGTNPIMADLNALTSEVVELAKPALEREGIKLQWRPGDIPVISLDTSQIKQVLWNLLQNAQKASKPGDTIWLSSWLQEGWIYLSVEDQGHGIVEKDKTELFKPFVSRSVTGLGLGLSICKRIASEHGGSIIIENRETGGVRACLKLPTSSQKRPG